MFKLIRRLARHWRESHNAALARANQQCAWELLDDPWF